MNKQTKTITAIHKRYVEMCKKYGEEPEDQASTACDFYYLNKQLEKDDRRWLKRILHGCRRFFKRLASMYEVGAWLDASAQRREWQDQACGWIPPTDNNF